MTKPTLSRSASSTTKVRAAKAATSGPLHESIVPFSEPTSKRWYVTFEDGGIASFDVDGSKDGRISFSRGPHTGGEVRIYRNSTTRVYEAVVTGVQHVTSERVSVRTVVQPTVERTDRYGHQVPAATPWGEVAEREIKEAVERLATPKVEEEPIPFDLLDPISQEKAEQEEAVEGAIKAISF